MLENYIQLFSSFTTARKAGKNAPHKAILMLSIIDLVEQGYITTNKIILDKQLEDMFSHLWKRYVGSSIIFKPNIAAPFWHLQNEPFYNLYHNGGLPLNLADPHYSISYLRDNTHALIDEDLFRLMCDESCRAELRVTLISKYLQGLHTPSEILMLILPFLTPILSAAV